MFPKPLPSSRVHEVLPLLGVLVLMATLGSPRTGSAAAPFTTFALTDDPIVGQPAGIKYFGQRSVPVLNNGGQVGVLAVLAGTGVTAANDAAYLRGTAGSMTSILRENETAPGTESLGPCAPWKATDPLAPSIVMNVAGAFAFSSHIVATACAGHQFAPFSGSPPTLHIAPSQGSAPGTTASFAGFSDPVLGQGGLPAFGSRLSGAGVDDSNDRGIWAGPAGSVQLVAREGDAAPGTAPGVVFASLNRFDISAPHRPRVNGAGELALWGRLAGPGVVAGFNDEGIWLGAPGALSLVVRTGDPAPGIGGGVVFSSILGEPGVNTAGVIAFHARVSGPGVTPDNSEGIWVGTPGNLALAARSGDPSPGVSSEVFGIGQLSSPALVNSSGEIAFVWQSKDPGPNPTRAGIWAGPPGGLNLVALEGEPAPGTAGLPFEASFGIVLSATGQVAFVGRATDGISLQGGVWATDPTGTLVPVLLDNESIEVRPGVSKVAASFGFLGNDIATGSGGEDGREHGFNAAGKLALCVYFIDNSSAVIVSDLAPGSTTGVPSLPSDASRIIAAPNPFHSSTRLHFGRRTTDGATLLIHDVAGRLIRAIQVSAGEESVAWDGRTEQGEQLPAGVYLVRLETVRGTDRARVALIR